MMRSTWIARVILVNLALSASAGEVRVGAAAVNITPAMGTPLAGYYSARSADSVHDDIHAKALVFEQDGSKAALVVCDLLTMPRSVVDESRDMPIAKETTSPSAPAAPPAPARSWWKSL